MLALQSNKSGNHCVIADFHSDKLISSSLLSLGKSLSDYVV